MTMATDETTERGKTTERERAVERLEKQRAFRGHLLVYALVNGVLVAIWAVVDVYGFFWPVFPILGWGVAVVLNAWDAYRNDAFSEEQVQREIEHLRRRM